MFHDVYGSELDVLHKLAAELAERFPEVASILGRDADPAMARLLQRLAFAFARVRQHIDDDVPEIIHAILEDVDPALLEPVLSTTLVELAPHPRTLRAATVIEAGATFADGAAHPCVFSMTEACEVRPWALREVRVVGGERREIRLSLEVLGGAELPRTIGSDNIVLALTAPLPRALDLRAWLLEHTMACARSAGAPRSCSPGMSSTSCAFATHAGNATASHSRHCGTTSRARSCSVASRCLARSGSPRSVPRSVGSIS